MEEKFYKISEFPDYEISQSGVVRRIKNKGFEIKLFDVRKLTGDILDEHYAHVKDKPFYPGMKEFMLSDYVVPMIVYGENAVQGMRDLMGPTKSIETL